jgi:hypothetical protein
MDRQEVIKNLAAMLHKATTTEKQILRNVGPGDDKYSKVIECLRNAGEELEAALKLVVFIED